MALEWFPGGQLKKITYPDNLIVTYAYDNFNRIPVPSALKNNPGTDLAGERRSTNAVTKIDVSLNGAPAENYEMTYNNCGQITRMTRPNSTQSDYSYDKAGRLTQIQHSGANIAFTAKYALDAVGNIISETFSGDSYYQDASLPEKMLFSYNIAGQLTKRGTQAAINDADGNITSVGGDNFKCTYDAENRLTKIERKTDTGTETTDNTYNADGLRVKKVVGTSTIVYHYLPSGLLLFTTDAAGTIIDRHIYADRALLASYNTADAEFIHYYGDRQAHVRLIADNTGTVLGRYDYLPYGQVGADTDNDAKIAKNPFTFNGILGVQDEGNGIFYMQQRFYDSASGRFFQRDPLGFAAGNNLYAFGKNNPMSYADPTGKNPLFLAVGAVSFVYLVMEVLETYNNANAESAEINAKYREAEVKKAKDLNNRYKGMPSRDREMFMKAERMHSYQSDNARKVTETGENIINRTGEALEITGSVAKDLTINHAGHAAETIDVMYSTRKTLIDDKKKRGEED